MTLNEIIELLLSTMDGVPYCVTSCDSLYWNEIIELLLSTMDRVLLFNFRLGGGGGLCSFNRNGYPSIHGYILLLADVKTHKTSFLLCFDNVKIGVHIRVNFTTLRGQYCVKNYDFCNFKSLKFLLTQLIT